MSILWNLLTIGQNRLISIKQRAVSVRCAHSINVHPPSLFSTVTSMVTSYRYTVCAETFTIQQISRIDKNSQTLFCLMFTLVIFLFVYLYEHLFPVSVKPRNEFEVYLTFILIKLNTLWQYGQSKLFLLLCSLRINCHNNYSAATCCLHCVSRRLWSC